MKPDLTALVRPVATTMLVLGFAACAHTEFHHQACVSGVDVTTDGNDGGTVTFSGTDTSLVDSCQGVGAGQGGFWIVSLDRSGPVRSSQDATVEAAVLGGEWQWWQADGTLQSGSVTGGRVIWPADSHHGIGSCGNRAAQVSVALSVLQEHPGIGTFEGCLDFAHVDPTLPWVVFPPRIWGRLTTSSP
ncbi:hypothetical protein CupriaWKF_29545 [Cupriavidus sp. WKF15]|uniref:hypothetical protein n=1 Tax=Cupriavidus sp. WKF15 TaxID=3032282 RepID=UPI0023E17551|nr:hypothetical protein [Cupriavidus sp. WKF15]WER48900.1 hypothetical protein CupriaWKF_29545 [Cupriavidus sp. WKF15]